MDGIHILAIALPLDHVPVTLFSVRSCPRTNSSYGGMPNYT